MNYSSVMGMMREWWLERLSLLFFVRGVYAWNLFEFEHDVGVRCIVSRAYVYKCKFAN